MTIRDRLERRVAPRLVVALSTVRWPWKVAARVRRLAGRKEAVRLYVAFDDPLSAVALLGLSRRLAGRRVRLEVEAVVERGIPGDPAVEQKRRYAVVDARRLARRDGRELRRSELVDAESVAFLAAWAAAAPVAERAVFCAAAMRKLWFESDAPLERAQFAELWRRQFGGEPPTAADAGQAERKMRKRRLYDTPVAAFGGQWWFAHERLAQIESALDELGCAAA